MDDINNKIYQFVESLVRDNLYHKYNNDYNQFMVENGMIIMFVEQNKNVISNEHLRKAIIDLISNDEYLNIVDRVRQKKVNNPVVETSNVNTQTNDDKIQFLPLESVEGLIQTEQDNAIYKTAIKLAVSNNYSHNLLIGVKNNHLEPVVRDLNNNEWRINENNDTLIDEEKGHVKKLKPIKTSLNQGFSNALILAFIIGSFIGIIFLNIYSKFMK